MGTGVYFTLEDLLGALDGQHGDLVPSTDGLAAGQHVTIQLKGGTLAATIEHVHPDETETEQ